MQHDERKDDCDAADGYEPCCDWVMHPENKAPRVKIIAGARRVPNSNRHSKKHGNYTHKHFAFAPDKNGKTAETFSLQTKETKVRTTEMQRDNIPEPQ